MEWLEGDKRDTMSAKDIYIVLSQDGDIVDVACS